MGALMGVFMAVGIVSYAAVVVAMAVLALDAWERGVPRRMVVIWMLWGMIALLQLLGLVAIQSGYSDIRLWYVNRIFWFVFGIISLSMAWHAFRMWLVRLIEHSDEWWLHLEKDS